MKFTEEGIEISSSKYVLWQDVKTLRILNNKLVFVFTNNQVMELSNLHPRVIDSMFRAYEKFLKNHPSKAVRLVH
ncbi:MAG: hypothetical protein WAM28_02110 [Chlamydiales bacterium]